MLLYRTLVTPTIAGAPHLSTSHLFSGSSSPSLTYEWRVRCSRDRRADTAHCWRACAGAEVGCTHNAERRKVRR